MTAELALALYYAFGVVWLATGFLPAALGGWLRHDMPPVWMVLYVVVFGAIWPAILARIVWNYARGIDETEL